MKPLGLWSRPWAPFWNVGMRPNSVVQTTRVSSSMPRAFRSMSRRGGRLVEDRAVPVVVGLDPLVAVPVELALAHGEGAVEEGDEPHAALEQPAGQQAVAAEARKDRVGIVEAVKLARGRGSRATGRRPPGR